MVSLWFLEQVTGIEPAYSAWEADTLPLSYTCERIYYTTLFFVCQVIIFCFFLTKLYTKLDNSKEIC